MDERELVGWVGLNMLPGVGPVFMERVRGVCADPFELAFRMSVEEIGARVGGRFSRGAFGRGRKGLRGRVREELRRARELGVEILVKGGPGYPEELLPLRDAPLLLYRRGTWVPGAARVALVGSRRATGYGQGRAEAFARELSQRGVEVVSGGARGIDTVAHRAALAARSRTVAVLGSGIDRLYPVANTDLFEKIAERGCLLSEFPLGHPPMPGNFPRRNRVVSGLVSAVVVIEAGKKSGRVAFLSCHLERTKAPSRSLPEGTRDLRRPPEAAAARTRAQANRGRRDTRRALRYAPGLGEQPEAPCRADGAPYPRLPWLLPLEATAVSEMAETGQGGSGAWSTGTGCSAQHEPANRSNVGTGTAPAFVCIPGQAQIDAPSK